MSKDEILELHKLDRKLAWAKLARWGVIKDLIDAENELMVESLADCAFRLRDEVDMWRFDDGFYEIAELVVGNNNEKSEMWEYIAQPIHWIQAALLAKEGK